MLHQISELKGFQIEARDGTIGKVKDLLFDDGYWTIRYIVVDTGGWLTGRKVLLSPAASLGEAIHDGKLPVRLSRSQVEQSPGIEEDQPVSDQFQRDLHTYYGWPAYWGAAPFPMAGVVPIVPAPGLEPIPNMTGPKRSRSGDPHLRSVRNVTGYALEATDGKLGHVEDFLVDTDAWVIRYLVVDTRNWLPGRKVMVAPGHVDRVSWSENAVAVDLTRAAVKQSPEFDPEAPWTEESGDRFLSSYDEPAHRR